MSSASETSPGWRFPAVFWLANGAELLERAAYYGTFIALALFLTDVAGFTDIEAGYIGALFAAAIYFLPLLSGAAADRLGFRSALLIAFASLSAGYGILGITPDKLAVIGALALVALGGSFVKPVIAGTVAKSSTATARARAYSIFYMVVNIGSFSGKTVAKPVRTEIGLEFVPLASAAASLLALLLVALFYHPRDGAAAEKPSSRPSQVLRDLVTVLRNTRFLALILITAGFWIIQGQMYASMPKYVLRMVGAGARPEWYANINPFVVVLLVVPITHLVRKAAPVTSIGVAMAIIPISAATMALSTRLAEPISFAGTSWHPVTVMMIIGIAMQGLAECFLSPRYLEYASKQSPPGQEGLYLGYSHLNIFFAWLVGFIASGYLLESYCPDPRTLSEAVQAQRLQAIAGAGAMPPAYAHAHYIWFVFAGIGAAAFLCLLLFQALDSRARARNAAAPEV